MWEMGTALEYLLEIEINVERKFKIDALIFIWTQKKSSSTLQLDDINTRRKYIAHCSNQTSAA